MHNRVSNVFDKPLLGTRMLLQAGEELKILGRVEMKEQIMATPAIIGDTLYLRTAGNLYAFREPALEAK